MPADKLAKEACGWREDGVGPCAPIPNDLHHLISAELCLLRARSMNQWEQAWNDTTEATRSGRAIRRFQPTPHKSILEPRSRTEFNAHPGQNGPRFAQSVPLPHEGSGHRQPYCSCGRGKENIEHVLLHCPNYGALREETSWGDGLRVSDLTELLGNPERVAMTTRFSSQTQRLPQFKRCAASPRIPSSLFDTKYLEKS